jgi:hypothetical protein
VKIPRIASLLIIRSLASWYLVSALATAQQAAAALDAKQQQVLNIAKEVRKQIVTLPQYGVFDKFTLP